MTMDDLISRKDAIDIMNAKGDVAQGTPKAVFYSAAHMLETLPAVDAEPVRYGRWIQSKTVHAYYWCSYCKSTHKMTKSCNKYVLLKYCPNCGAKMGEI